MAIVRKAVARKTESTIIPMVDFAIGDRTYQIDVSKQKVYRRFVEIERSKAFEILSTWRSRLASV
jgi:hypothetical protein